MNRFRRIKKIARVVIAARRAMTLHPLRAAVGGIYYVVCLRRLLLHWSSVHAIFLHIPIHGKSNSLLPMA